MLVTITCFVQYVRGYIKNKILGGDIMTLYQLLELLQWIGIGISVISILLINLISLPAKLGNWIIIAGVFITALATAVQQLFTIV